MVQGVLQSNVEPKEMVSSIDEKEIKTRVATEMQRRNYRSLQNMPRHARRAFAKVNGIKIRGIDKFKKVVIKQ